MKIVKDGIIQAGVTPALRDTPEFFEDTSFVAGDSPVTLDFNTALGRNATALQITNDGNGDIAYAFSVDGTTFGDTITIKAGETDIYNDISIDSLKITWVSNSSYRATCI